MRKTHIYFILILTVFISCNNLDKKNYTKNGFEGEDIYNVNADDENMNLAVAKAQKTLASFDSALVSNNDNLTSFCLKVKFTKGEENEHIWLGNIKKLGNNFMGVVDNEPIYIKDIKFGDTLKISRDKITDWQYTNKNKIVGSFTTKVIRNQMSEEDRKKFDQESNNAYSE